MSRTPEGAYFAGYVAMGHAFNTCEAIASKAETQQISPEEDEKWEKYEQIWEQLSVVICVLDEEIPPVNDYLWPGEEGAGITHLETAAMEYSDQPTLDNASIYVALRVIEEYVTQHTQTPQTTKAFEKAAKEAQKNVEPRYELKPDILREGVMFLREEVEKKLTPEEREKANRALE